MRSFRIVAMAYEETTPENERNIKKNNRFSCNEN